MTIPSTGEDLEQLECSYLAGVMQSPARFSMGKSLSVYYNTKYIIT